MPIVQLSLTIEDSDSDTSTVSVFINAGVGDDITSLTNDYALVLWDAIRPIVNCVLVAVNIGIKPDFSAWTNNTAVIISDVQEKAVFRLRPCGGERPIKLSIPTILESVFENSGMGELVDATNADIQAFYSVIENGVVDGGIGMVDSHGSDICEVLFCEQSFR